ncbi:hypothetical protein ACFLXY_00480 [Chloroflexota bacterium]
MEMINKHRWLVSLVIIAIVVVISVVIICSNQVFPTSSSGRTGVVAVSDDSGGVIVALHKDDTIYAQHIDSTGQAQWGKEGLFIAECPPGSSLTMIEDGLGGAVLSWYDTSARPDDHHDPMYFEPVPFYCRRITSDGQVIWSNGPVSTGRERFVIPDGTGGAIIAWDNYSVYYKGLWDNHLRLQKIASDGSYLWGDDGLLVVSSSPFRPLTDEEKAAGIKGTSTRSRPTYSGYHRIVSDDSGGVFVIWNEGDTVGEIKIYVQRLDSNGNNIWPEKISAGSRFIESAESDDEGGVIIRTSDEDGLEIHVNAEGDLMGTKQYGSSKLVIDDCTGGSFIIRVEEDPPYGDPRERLHIHWIKRLGPSGERVWKEQRALPDEGRKYECVDYTPDGSGGVIITRVLEKASGIYTDARARKLDSSGNIEWDEQGIPVFDIPGVVYQRIDTVFSDQSGGVIVISRLGESAVRGDMIYAQRLNAEGTCVWGGGIRVDH